MIFAQAKLYRSAFYVFQLCMAVPYGGSGAAVQDGGSNPSLALPGNQGSGAQLSSSGDPQSPSGRTHNGVDKGKGKVSAAAGRGPAAGRAGTSAPGSHSKNRAGHGFGQSGSQGQGNLFSYRDQGQGGGGFN